MGSMSPYLSSRRQSPLFKEREKEREREENGKMLLHKLGQILLPSLEALPAEFAEVKAGDGVYFCSCTLPSVSLSGVQWP